MREAAFEVRALLTEVGITSFIKTSGSKGLHIYARLVDEWNSYGVRSAAVALARELERRRPDLLTAQWWKEDRGERVFVDYNQNAPHKTVFGTWCVRPRVGGAGLVPHQLGGGGDRRDRRPHHRHRPRPGRRRRAIRGPR